MITNAVPFGLPVLSFTNTSSLTPANSRNNKLVYFFSFFKEIKQITNNPAPVLSFLAVLTSAGSFTDCILKMFSCNFVSGQGTSGLTFVSGKGNCVKNLKSLENFLIVWYFM